MQATLSRSTAARPARLAPSRSRKATVVKAAIDPTLAVSGTAVDRVPSQEISPCMSAVCTPSAGNGPREGIDSTKLPMKSWRSRRKPMAGSSIAARDAAVSGDPCEQRCR